MNMLFVCLFKDTGNTSDDQHMMIYKDLYNLKSEMLSLIRYRIICLPVCYPKI